MSDINWQLFDEVIADANAGRREFWMLWWFGAKYYHSIVRNHEAEEAFLEYGLVPDCNTPACACGSAILRRPEEAAAIENSISMNPSLLSVYGNPSFGKMVEIGARLYGIPSVDAMALFDRESWPSEYKCMSDLDGFVAIVERAKREGDFTFLLEGED